MKGRALVVVGAVLALTTAAPASALAGTASISGSQLIVSSSAAQRNALTVSVAGSDFLVAETGTGATLTAGSGCASGGLNQVLCPSAGITSMSLSGADDNDTLVNATATPASLDGGSGTDLLSGGPAADTLTGGTGSDYASYAGRTNPIVADLDGLADDGEVGENDRIATDVETLIGGSAADTLTGNSFNNGLDGGPGADHLNGGVGNDYVLYWTRTNPVSVSFDGVANDGEAGENDILGADTESAIGGAGNDTLVGNSGPNQLVGLDGNDTLDGQGGSDDLYGVDGVDTVLYSSRTAAVTVDLDGVADDGEAGEGDNVSADVENVSGGSAGDKLVGDGDANVLLGGAGNDILVGGGGKDVLVGSAGSDALRSRDGKADDVSCGSERDTVTGDPSDDVADDCEAVSTSASAARLSTKPVRMTRSGALPVLVACPAGRRTSCRGTITLLELPSTRSARASRRSRRRVLGKASFKVGSGHHRSVTVKASRHGRRRVLRKRKVQCQATVTMRGAGGRRITTRQTVTVTAPKRSRRHK